VLLSLFNVPRGGWHRLHPENGKTNNGESNIVNRKIKNNIIIRLVGNISFIELNATQCTYLGLDIVTSCPVNYFSLFAY
jgi:hypothetical protein